MQKGLVKGAYVLKGEDKIPSVFFESINPDEFSGYDCVTFPLIAMERFVTNGTKIDWQKDLTSLWSTDDLTLFWLQRGDYFLYFDEYLIVDYLEAKYQEKRNPELKVHYKVYTKELRNISKSMCDISYLETFEISKSMCDISYLETFEFMGTSEKLFPF